MSSQSPIETTGKTISKPNIDELVLAGIELEMILDYQAVGTGYFHIYVRHNNGEVVRQVYTQRNIPRKFRDLHRALDWGKSLGFKRIEFDLDFANYIPQKKVAED